MLIKKKRKREKCLHQKLNNNHYKIYMKPLPISRGFFMSRPELTSFEGIPIPFFEIQYIYIKRIL